MAGMMGGVGETIVPVVYRVLYLNQETLAAPAMQRQVEYLLHRITANYMLPMKSFECHADPTFAPITKSKLSRCYHRD
jgi:hypothetical protein